MLRAIVLTCLCLMSLSSCATHKEPVVVQLPSNYPIYAPTPLPSTKIKVWGDFLNYRLEAIRLIQECNIEKQAIYDSLSTKD